MRKLQPPNKNIYPSRWRLSSGRCNDKACSSQEKSLTSIWSLIGVTLVTISSGYFYVIGKFYYSSYFEHLGIDPDLFPIPFQETLFHGFIAELAIEMFILKLLMPIALAAIVFIIVVPMVKSRAQKRCAQEMLGSRAFMRTVDRKILELNVKSPIKFCWDMIIAIFIMAIFLYSMTIFIKKAEEGGIAWADNELKKISVAGIRTKATTPKKYVSILVSQSEKSEKLIEGYRIATSDKFIAIYTVDAIQIIPIKDIKSIATKINTMGKPLLR